MKDDQSFQERITHFGNIIEAERQAGRFDSELVVSALWNRIAAFWMLGDFDQSWQEHRRLLNRLPAKDWDEGSRGGRSLQISALLGFGDVIQIIRFLGSLSPDNGPIRCVTKPELQRLFAGSFDPDVSWCSPDDVIPASDLELEIWELPVLLRVPHSNLGLQVPYLRADRELSAEWSQKLQTVPHPRVGLCWTRHDASGNPDARSLPLAACLPLFQLPDLHFVSLQKEPRTEEIEACGLSGRLLETSEALNDFADTASLIGQLDLVVSCDTSVAHLAGAVGKPCHILLHHDAFIGWTIGADPASTHWYPQARLHRQKEPGDWSTVITDLMPSLSRLRDLSPPLQ